MNTLRIRCVKPVHGSQFQRDKLAAEQLIKLQIAPVTSLLSALLPRDGFFIRNFIGIF